VLDTPRVHTPALGRRLRHQPFLPEGVLIDGELKNMSPMAAQLKAATQEDIRDRIEKLRLTHSFLVRIDAPEEDARDSLVLQLKIAAAEAMLQDLMQGRVESTYTPSRELAPRQQETAGSNIVESSARISNGVHSVDDLEFHETEDNLSNYFTIPEVVPVVDAPAVVKLPPLPPPSVRPLNFPLPPTWGKEEGGHSPTKGLHVNPLRSGCTFPPRAPMPCDGRQSRVMPLGERQVDQGTRPKLLHSFTKRELQAATTIAQLPGMDDFLRDWGTPMNTSQHDTEDNPSARAAPSPVLHAANRSIMAEQIEGGDAPEPGRITTVPWSRPASASIWPERREPETMLKRNSDQLLAMCQTQQSAGLRAKTPTPAAKSVASSWGSLLVNPFK